MSALHRSSAASAPAPRPALPRAVLQTVLTTVLAIGMLGLGASPASARIEMNGVFSLPYTDTLYQASSREDTVRALDHAAWRDLGYPAPQPIGADYVRYPWSASIYAVTSFGPDPDDALVATLDAAAWTRAGSPMPRVTSWIGGSYVFRYELNDALYVTAPDGATHPLTAQEWRDAGSPAPSTIPNRGYVTLSWSGDILFLEDAAAGRGRPLSYLEWVREGRPSPRTVERLANDGVYRYRGSPTLYYRGGGLWKQLTFAQWQALGSPAPQIV